MYTFYLYRLYVNYIQIELFSLNFTKSIFNFDSNKKNNNNDNNNNDKNKNAVIIENKIINNESNNVYNNNNIASQTARKNVEKKN